MSLRSSAEAEFLDAEVTHTWDNDPLRDPRIASIVQEKEEIIRFS